MPVAYVDCGEGPWETEQAARGFAEAEVGVPWCVVYADKAWRVLTRQGCEGVPCPLCGVCS